MKKSKKYRVCRFIFMVFFISFLVVYFSELTGYYEYQNYKQAALTKEQIKKFEEDLIEKARKDGYVDTLYRRRRYIPEINSSSYMVRQFGIRIATNTPIQGTAADIMKIAMINVYNRIKKEKLRTKIVLQIHDELLLEAPLGEKEQVKELLKAEMEDAVKLLVPLTTEVSEANNWEECK